MNRPTSAAGLALAAALAAPAVAPAETQLELAVKAAYLDKLAPFVSWPAAQAPPGLPFVICVQGADPFGPVLDRTVAGQQVFARPIVVRRMTRLGADSGCQIAYVAGSDDQSRAAALKAVAGEPVLTVTDDEHGSGSHGIVNLVLSEGRVRFAVDLGQARQNGLAISSKLLALAVQVKR